jgi:hypothetical protein
MKQKIRTLLVTLMWLTPPVVLSLLIVRLR